MAKVSIIIPTYNVEPYLRLCMDTITGQTLTDIEIICINDGSTDGSLAILQSYAAKDSRIRIVDKENGGYGIGMNIGLDMATGEYIGILEPDDHVPLDMYGDLYQIAAENDLDFVKADFYRFKEKEDGELELDYNHLSKNPEDYNKVFDPSHTPEAIRYLMNTWSGIYRRAFLEEYHIRHNETPGASFQDNGFWFQTFIYAKRGMIIDKPYYRNRRDNPNSSVSNPQKVYCTNVEYDHIRAILLRDPELWERFHGMYWMKRYNNGINSLKRIADDFKWPFIQQMSRELKRGLAKDEIDLTVFQDGARSTLLMIANNPRKYYEKRILKIPSSDVPAGTSFPRLRKKHPYLFNEFDEINEMESGRFRAKLRAIRKGFRNQNK